MSSEPQSDTNTTQDPELSESNEARQKFGSRHLEKDDDVFKHNAWDNVEWDEKLQTEALEKINKNSVDFVPVDKQELYNTKANLFWDKFYEKHQDKFFKNRHWLFTEFPELLDKNPEFNITKQFSILEIGCGVGNSVIPILEGNLNPKVFLYCCDFSETAVNLVLNNPTVIENQLRCKPFVCDVSSDIWTAPFNENSLDVVLLTFVLSAIHPDKMPTVLNQIFRYLKPGGSVFIRDYGRYDMAQLRFKNGSCLAKNFYVRGDGTQVYFFEKEEVEEMFTSVGFEMKESVIDRRLQVNRSKRLTMYRVWVQGKYVKP